MKNEIVSVELVESNQVYEQVIKQAADSIAAEAIRKGQFPSANNLLALHFPFKAKALVQGKKQMIHGVCSISASSQSDMNATFKLDFPGCAEDAQDEWLKECQPQLLEVVSNLVSQQMALSSAFSLEEIRDDH